MNGIRWQQLAWVAVFSVAFAFVESAVVVYLRALSYPDGFHFPLAFVAPLHARVEVAREAATLLMLLALAFVTGRRAWERFGWFLIAFGIWDIFYYVWLKVLLDWPQSLTDWDILFLIPVPWVGPVIAPLIVALVMVVFGVNIIHRATLARPFSPGVLAWFLASAGGAMVLLSFLQEAGTVLRGGVPSSYSYTMLAIGLMLGVGGYLLSCRARSDQAQH